MFRGTYPPCTVVFAVPTLLSLTARSGFAMWIVPGLGDASEYLSLQQIPGGTPPSSAAHHPSPPDEDAYDGSRWVPARARST